MTLEEAFGNVAPNNNVNRNDGLCIIGRVIKDHPEGSVIQDKVADLRWSAPVISKVLAGESIRCSASAIRVHRREQCACYGVGN